MKPTAWIAIVVVAACGNVEDHPDALPSSPDADPSAPDAAAGTPDAEPDATPVSCTANAFIACEDVDTARLCNATGNGFVAQECGVPGCNGSAQRCNECVPSTDACDGAVVERCDADGLAMPDEACATTCLDAPSAHCEYLSPHYLPDVCDAPATTASFTISTNTTLDTSLDTACTGGVIDNICVVRAATISLDSGTLTAIGSRPLALVGDDSVTVAGILDASASGTQNGAGGTRVSGNRAGGTNGGGGAGFKQNGMNGGAFGADGGGSSGGAIFDPLALTTFAGGAHQQSPLVTGGAFGGGGGGAVTLIACRGQVTVTGTIDVNGGGGAGGIPDPIIGGGTAAGIGSSGGGGGGSGGYVVVQGMSVSVTGKLYANGGGGGGGASGNTNGSPGADGLRSVFSGAAGGNAPGTAGGKGGSGGIGSLQPTVGRAHQTGGTAGGGGGSAGELQVYVPTGVTPTIAPTESSPLFQPTLTTPTR